MSFQKNLSCKRLIFFFFQQNTLVWAAERLTFFSFIFSTVQQLLVCLLKIKFLLRANDRNWKDVFLLLLYLKVVYLFRECIKFVVKGNNFDTLFQWGIRKKLFILFLIKICHFLNKRTVVFFFQNMIIFIFLNLGI